MKANYPNLELIEYKAEQTLLQSEEFKAKLACESAGNRYVRPEFDVTVFSQVWGSTCTGFDVCKDGTNAIGGCAMTKEYTTVVRELRTNTFIVFFGNRQCYMVTQANEDFFADVRDCNMASLSEAKLRY